MLQKLELSRGFIRFSKHGFEQQQAEQTKGNKTADADADAGPQMVDNAAGK